MPFEPPSEAASRLSAAVRDALAQLGVAEPAWSQVTAITRAADIPAQFADGAEALLRDDAAFATFSNHQHILKRGNGPERLAYLVLSQLAYSGSHAARSRLLDELEPTDTPFDALRLEADRGCLLTRPRGWALYDDAIAEARAAFEAAAKEEADPAAAVNLGKTFMSAVPLPGGFDSKLMALAKHPSTLRLVGRYLGGLPILMRINLLKSSNTFMQDGSSQFFHIDPEDFRQMKLFLMITDIDEKSGPLHLLPVDASDVVRTELAHRHGRLQDDQVFDLVGREPLVQCVGESGTIAFGDTSRCFHFGSRIGERERWVVMIQYVTPYAASFPIGPADVKAKYTDAVRARADSGVGVTERDEYLYGLRR